MANIYKSITAVMREVGAIGKGSENAQQRFSYRSIDDIYNRVQPLMAKHGIFSTPEVIEMEHELGSTKSGGTLFHLWCRVKYTFYAEDGSSVETVTIGESMDSGDKSGNKAMAAAHKYALVQIFALPFESMDPDQFTPQWAAEMNGQITPQQFKQLKGAWWATVKERMADSEPEVCEKEFADWANAVANCDFDPLNWREWTKEDLAACNTKLNSDAAATLVASGLE